ncbi:MAG: phospho-sugar mutase [Ruminococcaceae bacterium]|nr:phospho-sugar mutase [Oscillospiraceae bacterium]
MDGWQGRYERWCSKVTDEALRAELAAMDEAQKEDAFYRELEFGTGGLRGVLGAGSNRMNVYVVARASQGIADYLHAEALPLSAAIGYDSRLFSRRFADTAAAVFASNGIRVHMYPQLMPAPALSFAVRHFGCGIGVIITASHNPAEYNGYKVYGGDGCQITSEAAKKIQAAILSLDTFDDIASGDGEEISFIGEEVKAAYLDAVSTQSLYKGGDRRMPIVYTPLNGAGISCVPEILSRHGFENIIIPAEQREPDGNFPTCPYPNPEIREALELGLRTAEKCGAELLLATDPDCDRVGCAVKTDGGYALLNGNQTGVLLLDYICRMRELPERPLVVKTIVTTPMALSVAKKYGAEVVDTLTGFKYIGEYIGELEKKGEAGRYVFGFEESYGYLSHTAVRDKDAVNASLLVAELFLYHRSRGKTLADALEELYEEHGYYRERLLTFSFPGRAGLHTMQARMAQLRADPEGAERWVDYLGEGTGLPKSDVLQLWMPGGALVTVRPSGTEPKLKIYLAATGESRAKADAVLDALEDRFGRWVKGEK